MAAHRYWRLTISALSAGSSPLLGELELRTTAAGANLPISVGGTASASNTSYNAASAGFNGDQNSVWGYAYIGEWLKWDFGVGNDQVIEHVTLKNGDLGSIARVTSGVIAWSDDDSSWTDLMIVNGSGTLSAVTATQYVEPYHGTLERTISALSAVAYAGGNGAGSTPAATARGYGGANLSAELPNLSISAFARKVNKSTLEATLGSLTMEARGGANLQVTLPGLTLETTATFPVIGRVTRTLPSLTISASGTTTAIGSMDATLPDTFSMVGYSGAVCSVSLENGLTLAAQGTTGGVGALAVTLPLFELTATATQNIHGSADVLLPALRMADTAQAWIVMPSLKLTAIGTATVALTYEAYALNLKHTPRGPNQEVNDELTHFTNYPFDKIIRYQNSYYGVNSTGLYLLEGTTDDAAPIAYSVKTKLTDFGTDQKKTPEAAVFGGRLGPDATVTVYTGETEDDVYAYTTPRGQDVQNYRQKFGKGLKARYYAFGIQGDGAMALDTVSFDIAKLKRRI